MFGPIIGRYRLGEGKGRCSLKPGIKELHTYINGEFSRKTAQQYEGFQILSEADLQAFSCRLLQNFLRRYQTDGNKLLVMKKLYIKDLRIHPDIVTRRRKKPAYWETRKNES